MSFFHKKYNKKKNSKNIKVANVQHLSDEYFDILNKTVFDQFSSNISVGASSAPPTVLYPQVPQSPNSINGGSGYISSYGKISAGLTNPPQSTQNNQTQPMHQQYKNGDIIRFQTSISPGIQGWFPGDAIFRGHANAHGYYAVERLDRTPGAAQNGWWLLRIDLLSYTELSIARNDTAKLTFNLNHLDALVIDQETKNEIVAVLKQHKHSNKLFEEWGLNETIKYGKGMTLLFWGKPGTGKTWGANCIAKVFDTELITISAAEIQTSEPGGANRNIQNAFAESKKTGKVLFLDECDSLITSRNDVGMILGGEINTLLTEIEKFEGVCILATNRIDTLDEALERRIALIVEFEEPNFEARRDIWKKILPAKMPLEKGVTPESLGTHKLTGGQIKNVVLQAARLAVSAEQDHVTMANFESAVDRVHKSKALMGKRPQHNQIRVIKEEAKTEEAVYS